MIIIVLLLFLGLKTNTFMEFTRNLPVPLPDGTTLSSFLTQELDFRKVYDVGLVFFTQQF